MSFLTTVLAEGELARELPIPAWAYGAIALAVFFVLAIVVWNYRDVSNRHKVKADAYAAAHGADHGHGGH
ncbi:hypothetical protein [Luethyella okanaganae]|uniref:Uncharacterized protein n=1 Tax=Luethyella okanaganae TaxID=69372 RepID=A0ABW1VC51_9MICO